MTRCLGYATLLGDTTPLSVKMQSGFAVGILHLSGVFGVCDETGFKGGQMFDLLERDVVYDLCGFMNTIA